jgi:diadenosine tetraphosphate (Ap4A) HIT family hydrolase
MSTPRPDCPLCAVVAGSGLPPSYLVYQTPLWRLDHNTAPSDIPGWLVLKPTRHVENLAELTPEEAMELGQLIPAVAAAIQQETKADRVYLVSWGESARHIHIHFVPRALDWPVERRAHLVFNFDRNHPGVPAAEVAVLVPRIRQRLLSLLESGRGKA